MEKIACELIGQPAYDKALVLYKKVIGIWITPEGVFQFIRYLKNERYARNSLAIYKCGLFARIKQTLLSKQKNGELFQWEQIMKSIKTPRTREVVKTHQMPTGEEIIRLLKHSPKRVGVIIEVFYFCSLRASEMCSIKLVDCHLINEGKGAPKKVIISILGKGNRAREIYMPLDLFHRIRKEFQGNVYLFETETGKHLHRNVAWKYVSRYGRAILGKKIWPHLFRHCFVNHVKEYFTSYEDKDMSDFMGNSPETINAVYRHSKGGSLDVPVDFYMQFKAEQMARNAA